MARRVLKYGGKSLSSVEKLKNIASQISEWRKQGDEIVVVVSAMGDSTNDLISLASQISKHPDRRELDMLISTGERVSMSLMSMALNDLKCPAISFTGSQAGILTDNKHTGANIVEVKAHRIAEALSDGKLVVLAGFQGVCPETKEITTLGRGGTDTTAVAMADFLNADFCEMYKDVDGVFNCDPKLVFEAEKIPELDYNHMLHMCVAGAKVVHPKAIKLAREKNVVIKIKKAHDNASVGTTITKSDKKFNRAISLNHSPTVYEFKLSMPVTDDKDEILHTIKKHLHQWNFSDLKIIDTFYQNDGYHFFLRGTDSNLDFFVRALEDDPIFDFVRDSLAEFSLTYAHKDFVSPLDNNLIYYQKQKNCNLYLIVDKRNIKNFASQIFTKELS